MVLMAVKLCVLCGFYNVINSKDIYHSGTSPRTLSKLVVIEVNTHIENTQEL